MKITLTKSGGFAGINRVYEVDSAKLSAEQATKLSDLYTASKILDFKSNRPPPGSLAKVDPAYVRQLALYRRAMLDVFPGRAVRAALLWTEGPNLMELPESLMEAHLI